MENIASTILTGIVIGTVTAWVTVMLSLKRFRSEKLWERKVNAYTSVIEALHHLKAVLSEYLYSAEGGPSIPEDKGMKLQKRFDLAQQEIEKATDVAALLLSNEALERLMQYRRDSAKEFDKDSYYEYLDHNVSSTSSCLKAIIELAKTDLKK